MSRAPGTPDLLRLVVQRELRPRALFMVLGAAAAAVAVSYTADAEIGGMSTLADAIVRRFDLTVLWISAILSGAHITLSLELDERDGWLDSFVAAGGSRIGYVVGIALGGFVGASAIFLAGATAFACAVGAFHDSSELVRALPRTAAGGLLVIAHWCVWFALVGVLARRAMPSLAVALAIAAAPTIMMFTQLMRVGSASEHVVRTMVVFPPLVWGGIGSLLWLQLSAMAMMAALAMFCATRMTGRHT